MKRENWEQVKQVFYSALKLAPDEREIYLENVCAGDKNLYREVEILLQSYQSDFLEKHIPGSPPESAAEKEQQLQSGEQIKHYKILHRLGAGGMGEVYLAEDTKLHRPVAVKVLQSASIFDVKAERRLLREARAAALLNHPNICTIHEIDANEKYSFIVMEYIKGETLDRRIKDGSLSIRDSLAIILDIADALSEAHSHGIVHRDIKPANVIINQRGQIKVLDFGLAKRTIFENEDSTQSLSQSGAIAGTVSYMSPEQARGQEIDIRSDIWSLGVVFYEMMTQNLPFKGETKPDIMAAILVGKYLSPTHFISELPPGVDRIIKRALQKDRQERFSTIKDFILELNALQSELNEETTARKEGTVSINPEVNSDILRNLNFTAKATVENTPSTGSELLQTKRDSGTGNVIAAFTYSRSGVLMLAGLIILSFISWQVYQRYSKDTRPFSSSSRNNLQITSLFSTKRKLNGAITNVSFSPDGNLVAFLLTGDGNSDIYIKQIGSGEPIKLTNGKDIDKTASWKGSSAPIWSPDGQRLAFISERDSKFGIWTVSYLGGTPVLQIPLDSKNFSWQLKKWSNDGKRIFFETSGALKTIELDSGKISEISLPEIYIAGSFNISKDETLISYVVIEDNKEKIWIQFLESGKTKDISNNDFSNWSPAFFPDNRRLAYSSNQNGNFQIYVYDLSTSENTQITFGDSNANMPTISPDGMKMIYVSELDEANIFSFDLKAEKETQQTSKTKLQLFPDISPSSGQMVFQVTDYQAKIYASPLKIKTPGTENEPNEISRYGGWAKWSPNGEKIAFLKFSGTNVNLCTISVADQKEKQLTSDGVVVEVPPVSPYNQPAMPFRWSPDGKKLVYASRRSGFNDIWIIDEDGSNPRNLTNNSDKNLRFSSPFWSSQGNQVAFSYRLKITENQYQYGVSVIKEGKLSNLFQSNNNLRLLGWSRNGNTLIAAINNPNFVELIEIPAAPGYKKESLSNFEGANIDGITLSSDAQKVIFSARRNGIDNVYLYQMRGKELQLTKNLENTVYYSGLTSSPDGNILFYSKQSGGMQISMISELK